MNFSTRSEGLVHSGESKDTSFGSSAKLCYPLGLPLGSCFVLFLGVRGQVALSGWQEETH